MGSAENGEAMKLMVAVDFGTTFSSMALALSTKHRDQEVITWWGDDVLSGEDVPTLLEYARTASPGSGPYKWGFQVGMDHGNEGTVYEWFKLGLYPHLRESELASRYPSKTPQLTEAECRKLIVHFLTAMRKNFEEFMVSQRPEPLRNISTEYIITVPAIWTDRAKDITRSCAAEAGMGRKSDVHIIKEPEAAGIYALDTIKDIDLKVNDTFVLCDAGGGTVDLISYTVTTLKPAPILTEAAEGSGGLCGGTFLNRIFEDYLDKKIRPYPGFDDGWKKETMKRFEDITKRTFAGDTQKKYTFVARNLPNIPGLGNRKDYLEVPGRDIERIFKQVIDEIAELVLAQIRATNKTVKAVLLAGGFGKSGYLRLKLQEAIDKTYRSIPVKTVKNSNTAIVRGALLMGLTYANKNLPYARSGGRIPTRSYGVPKWVDFDPSKGHDPSKRFKDRYRTQDQIEIMDWFIEQGRLMENSEKRRVEFCTHKYPHESFKQIDIIVYSYESRTGEKPPVYRSQALKKHAELKPKLFLISESKLRQEDGKHIADFELESMLNSANLLIFNMIHDGMRYGEESIATELK